MIDWDRTEKKRQRQKQREIDEFLLSSSDSLHNCTTIQGLIYLCRKLGFSISKSTRFCALAPSKSRYTEQLCSPAFQYNPRFRLCSCLMLSFPLFFLFLPSSHYLQILLSSSSSFSPVSFPLQTTQHIQNTA